MGPQLAEDLMPLIVDGAGAPDEADDPLDYIFARLGHLHLQATTFQLANNSDGRGGMDHKAWAAFSAKKMQAAAEAAGHDDWKGYIVDKKQIAAEAAGFSSPGAHIASTASKRGKGKESVMDRAVKRQAELNSISGGGWTLQMYGSKDQTGFKHADFGRVSYKRAKAHAEMAKAAAVLQKTQSTLEDSFSVR